VSKEKTKNQGLMVTVHDQIANKTYLQMYSQTVNKLGHHTFVPDFKNTLYGMEIYSESQPMVLDIDGD